MKKISVLNTSYFANIYSLLAVANIDSEALVYGVNNKIAELLADYEDSKICFPPFHTIYPFFFKEWT